MTLASKLKAMTDEQLAVYICKNFFPEVEDCIRCPAASMCTHGSNGMIKLLTKEVADEEKVPKVQQGKTQEGNQGHS